MYHISIFHFFCRSKYVTTQRVIMVFFCFFSSLGFFIAQETNAAGNVSVTPSIIRLDLAQDSEIVDFIYHNSSDETITLRLSVKNFTSLEDGWKVQFTENSDESQLEYSLASWIRFEQDSLILNPGETRTVKVFIDKEQLSPGGHYASVIAEIQPDTTTPETLSLKYALSSLLFVRGATGSYHASGSIEKVTVNSNWYSFPDSVGMNFNNTGNVELIPYGEAVIINHSGVQLAKGIINENSFITLPESIRNYSIPIRKNEGFIWPGIYRLRISVHFDEQVPIILERSFFTLGSFSAQQIIFATILCIFSIILLVRVYKKRT